MASSGVLCHVSLVRTEEPHSLTSQKTPSFIFYTCFINVRITEFYPCGGYYHKIHHIDHTFAFMENSVAFSPQANYIDWATATCLRNLVPNFADRGVSRGQCGGSPTVVNLSFLDRSRYFSFKYLFIYHHSGWVHPVPDPLLLRKSGTVGNRTQDLSVCSQEPLWKRVRNASDL
jgi:hypothetical protein